MNIKIAFVNDVPATTVPATLYIVKGSIPTQAKMYASPSLEGPLREITTGSSSNSQWNYKQVSVSTVLQPDDFVEVTSSNVTLTLPSSPSANDKVRVMSTYDDTVVHCGQDTNIQTTDNKTAVINRQHVVVEFFYSGSMWYFT